MTSVLELVFAITTIIVCRGSNAWLVKRDGSGRPCSTTLTTCIWNNIDVAYIYPVTKPDGGLVFPANFFTRICGYFNTIVDCYGKVTLATCEPYFQQKSIKEKPKLQLLSTNLCRNKDVMNTLVPCLNDKDFYEACTRAFRYKGAEKESKCNVSKERIRRVLRVFKDRCGDAEYTSLKSVSEDFGDDLGSTLFENAGCKINVRTLT